MVQPPTKRINISTRQSGLWDCKQRKKETNSVSSMNRDPTRFHYTETVRQKKDRTLHYYTRPSEETGLFAILRDRQKRPDSFRSSKTVVVARQSLVSRDKKFSPRCSLNCLYIPTGGAHNATRGKVTGQPDIVNQSGLPRVQAGHDPYWWLQHALVQGVECR